MIVCSNCGYWLSSDTEICPRCHTRQRQHRGTNAVRPDPYRFMDRDKWAEIYDRARENGYTVPHFIVETLRRGLSYPRPDLPGGKYVAPDSQIVIKLEKLEEDIIYRLCINDEIWPKVG